MTNTNEALVATLQALPADALAQACLEIDEVRPDVRAALVDLSRGDVAAATSRLAVTAAYLDARQTAITTAIAANAAVAQQN